MKLELSQAIKAFEIDDFRKECLNYKFPVVYCFYNKVNQKIYIGSSYNMHKRYVNYHLAIRDVYKFHSPILKRAFTKYGSSGFLFLILEQWEDSKVSKEELLAREQFYLDTYSPFGPNGYNSCPESSSCFGSKRSEEVKRKNSELQRTLLNNAILRKEDIVPIFEMFDRGISRKEIAKTFGVKQKTLACVLSRETWFHVEVPEELENSVKNKLVSQISLEKAFEIGKILLEHRFGGKTVSAIAKENNIDVSVAKRINLGSNFPEVLKSLCNGDDRIIPRNFDKNIKVEEVFPSISSDILDSSQSYVNIAKKYNICSASVIKAAKRIGAPRRAECVSFETAMAIGKDLLETNSTKLTALKFSVSLNTVQNISSGNTFPEVLKSVKPGAVSIVYSRKNIPLSRLKYLVILIKQNFRTQNIILLSEFSGNFVRKWTKMYQDKQLKKSR